MLSYTDSNLFDSQAQALVNPVNTAGAMGKGLALEFKRRYPAMYKEYHNLCRDGTFTTGMLHICRIPDKIIVNLATKEHWRQPSRLKYIESGLQKFARCYSSFDITSVSFPQLGCGLGGLDWESEVQPLMERYLCDLEIAVYIHLYPR